MTMHWIFGEVAFDAHDKIVKKIGTAMDIAYGIDPHPVRKLCPSWRLS